MWSLLSESVTLSPQKDRCAPIDIAMPRDPQRKYPEWRKAFWLIFLAIAVTLIVSLIGLLLLRVISYRQ